MKSQVQRLQTEYLELNPPAQHPDVVLEENHLYLQVAEFHSLAYEVWLPSYKRCLAEFRFLRTTFNQIVRFGGNP